MKRTLAAIVLYSVSFSATALPAYADVRAAYRPSHALLLDRHGAPLQQVRVDASVRRLSWVALADISPALLASEDKRFYEHAGVDWNAVAAAAWGSLWHSRTRGASTITMQLAGLLDDDLQRGAAPRSGSRKVAQALAAQSLERGWRKDQILEAYLNLVSFRGELVGVHALARVLFGKDPNGLDQVESALAAALIRAPNAAPALVARRACAILTGQGVPGLCGGLDGVAQLVLARMAGPDRAATSAPQLAPHLGRRLLAAAGGPVASTLDAGLQRHARDALQRHLAALDGSNVEDGAVLVLDNATGDVLAWVGSSGALSGAEQVDAVLALRQAGSTLKPFLYSLALEQRWLTAASLLDDSPLNLATASGLYMPQNYDQQYKGLVSLRTALASSLNIPAVRTLVTVTPERLFQRLQALGFKLRESGDYYGYSLALGSADVSLLALTNAYRAFAAGGRYQQVRTVLAAPAARPVQTIDPGAAWIIGDILSDPSARARTFGMDSVLSTRSWSAVKTGTSKDMRDNWCIGYSARYTVGVWVGNASGRPMWNVSGVSGAAPVWQDVMHYLHAGVPAPQPPAPAGVQMQAIRYANHAEAARTEFFLAGTAQSVIVPADAAQLSPAIRYPTPGMVVALDPDIPPSRQRIRLLADGVLAARWRLDGKPLSGNDWAPWPGRHALALTDAGDKVLDEVRFEVRGAVVRVRQK